MNKISKDYLHFSEKMCRLFNQEKIEKQLKKIKNRKYNFVCINDLYSLKAKVNNYRKYLPKDFEN